ncbi:ABC transporter permease [Acinetobacter sp. GSS19]|uniref:ABC transporter permease n=1 Tax=Acinetobacter sp. GSS19 TaxID=3020716 RepID=UPI00235F2613|nr:ABC transporter permease [Acinetobacter sp. GSS19]
MVLGLISSFLKDILNYKSFIFGSIKREFQTKYRNSLLGVVWNILNPLAMILVYTVIFSQVMKAKLPGVEGGFSYSIYLCAGILVWGLLSELINRTLNMFIDNANLLKKINFPRLCLPAVVVGSALSNFLIIFGLFTLFLIISGNFPGLTFFSIFPLVVLLIAFAIGLGTTLGILNVFFRDVGHFFGIFLTFWFWLTPIVYPIGILPESFREIIMLNPMAPLVVAFQDIFVHHQWPEWKSLWLTSLLSITFCCTAMTLYRRHAGEMVDEL